MHYNITTNNHKRPLLYWDDLTDDQRREFDHYDATDGIFVQYRGDVIDVNDTESADPRYPWGGAAELWRRGWTRYITTSMGTAIVFRLCRDDYGDECAVVGYLVISDETLERDYGLYGGKNNGYPCRECGDGAGEMCPDGKGLCCACAHGDTEH